MKLNDMWRAIMFNWPVKMFSLVLAIGLYLVINYATLDQRKVEIPLQVRMPVGYEATSTVPASVMLIIKSDARHIGLIDPSAITAIADFSAVDSEGAVSVPVLLEADRSYLTVEVSLATDPEVVRVYFSQAETADGGDSP